MEFTVSRVRLNARETVREYVNHSGTKLVTGHPRVFDSREEALQALHKYLGGLPADDSWEVTEFVEEEE